MRILITGSNGLLGQHLLKILRENPNHTLLATARGANRLKEGKGFTYQSMDLCDREQTRQVVLGFRPEAIIHAAAMTQVDDCELQPEQCRQVNVDGTAALLSAAEQTRSFFLLVSTDFVFDGLSGPYREEDAPHPLSVYGQSKLDAEELVRKSDLPWAIARTVLVYGIAEDLSRTNIVLWVRNSLVQGKTIRVVDDQWRTPTLVQDLAFGCRLITEKKAKGIFNISGMDLLTPYQMACQTAEFFGLDASLIQRADGTSFSQAARRPARTGFVLEKARRELGYQPHSFREGLALVARDLG
ncbi:MAG TPA: SDR family oxidoreductase [Chitinophagaceae bacterium]|nr:SDR family oxidoreductase [Chitinophagaceae bacterium]